MFDDEVGTCYEKTTHQSFMTQHKDKYVMQVIEYGSDTNAKPTNNCTSVLREDSITAKYQKLPKGGGYAVRGGASGIIKSKLMISGITLMSILFASLMH